MKHISHYQVSPRVRIERGSMVRLSGGPETSSGSTLTMPGKYVVLNVYGKGKRVWLEVRGLDKVGGTYIVFVHGRAYTRHCVHWKPFKVRRAKLPGRKK